jgi:bifunctional non-homologous end joining protein LigD
VEPSNLEKVFWPDDGLTKGDLLDYFDAVSPYLLPVVRGRPLTVIRYPDGIGRFSFYQKETPKYAPPWVKTVMLPAYNERKTVRYTVCDSKRTLLWLGNQACIELHPWISRVDRIERPDYLVLDLDPPEESFERAVETAFACREVLDGLDVRTGLKTSGSKGVHLYVPLQRRYSYQDVRAFAEMVAGRVAERNEDLATTSFRKAGRAGRVFLDTGRVAPGAHIVAPYSPRARPGGTVSFPVTWDELGSVSPQDFTLRTVPGLLEREGDKWKKVLPDPQRLPPRRSWERS